MTLKIAHIYPFSPQVLNYSDRDWESSQVPLGANRVLAALNSQDNMQNEIWNYTQSATVLDRTLDGLRFISFPRDLNFLPARMWGLVLNGFNRERSRQFAAYLAQHRQDLIHLYGLFHKHDWQLVKGTTPYVMEHMGGEIYFDRAKVEIFSKARAIIFSSATFLQKYCQQYGLDNGLYIPIPTDLQLFQPAQNLPTKKQLIFVGQIYKEKDVLEAVEVAKGLRDLNVKDVQLVIVGKIVDAAYWQKVVAYIEEHQLQDQVSYLGYIQDKSKLADIMRESLFLLFPSYKESFGQVVIEAMSCAIPALVLQGSVGPEDIIADGVDGVISSRTDLLNHAHRLVEDPQYRLQLGQNGRRKVQQHFNFEQRYASVKQLYLNQ
ncbi:MAG: glycosyltransferase family 4 protein [Proteobacteria bacterium]|nr:glycosyltransferase family 4 protein [Pseudomonadota bacterium]